jgi:hypothetical protein
MIIEELSKSSQRNQFPIKIKTAGERRKRPQLIAQLASTADNTRTCTAVRVAQEARLSLSALVGAIKQTTVVSAGH